MNDVEVWAERLVNVWTRMRQGLAIPNDELSDAENLQWLDIKMEFDAMIVDIGLEGLLDDVCQTIFAEKLEDIAIDDDDLDLETQFHHDLFFALSNHFYEVVDDEDETHAALSEIVAIPVFGDRHILNDMIWRPGFVEQMRGSKLVHDNSNVLLLGLIPIDQAHTHMIQPQKLFDVRHGSANVLNSTEYLLSEAGDQELQRIKQAFGVDQLPKGRKEGTQVFGGYLAVFSVVSVAATLDDLVDSSIDEYSEEQLNTWNENLDAWMAEQDDQDDLKRQNISHPLLYRDAVAFSMADFAMHNMFLQHSIGGSDSDTISRFEVVVPDDANEGISLEDVVQIIGYTQNNELMGSIQYNAVSAAFVHDDLVACWDLWLGAQTDVVARQNFAATKQRKLH